MFSTSKSLLRGCLMSKWATNHHAICSGIIWSVPNLGWVGTNPLVTFLYMENNNNQQNINFVEYQRLTMRYSNKFNVVDQEKKGFKGEKHDPQNNGDCSEITQRIFFNQTWWLFWLEISTMRSLVHFFVRWFHEQEPQMS